MNTHVNQDVTKKGEKMRVKSVYPGSSSMSNHVSSTGQVKASQQDMMILTSNLSNGSVLYAPVMSPKNGEHNGLLPKVMYGNQILQTIIANDVKDQSRTKFLDKNLDSRDTVVKKGPGGAVQITYKKMVNQTPTYSLNQKILPKPPANFIPPKSESFESLLQCFSASNTLSKNQNFVVNRTSPASTPSYSSVLQNNQILSPPNQTSKLNNSSVTPNNNISTTNSKTSDVKEGNVSMMQLPNTFQSFSILAPALSETPSSSQCELPPKEQSLFFSGNQCTYSGIEFQNNISDVSMSHLSSTKDCVSVEGTTKAEPTSFCALQLSTMSSMDPGDHYDDTNDYSNMDNMFDPVTFDRLTSDRESLELEDDSFSVPADPMLTSQCFTSVVCNPITTDLGTNTHPLSIDTSTVNTSLPTEGLVFTDGFMTDKDISCSSRNEISNELQTLYDNFNMTMNHPTSKSLLNTMDIDHTFENTDSAEHTGGVVDSAILVSSYTFDSGICTQVTSTPVMTSPRKEGLLDIIDVSPEVVSTSGGSKIILIGSWNAKNARYACQFGNVQVDAELIQNGVLRCYSPIHEAGKVQICIFCDGKCISKKSVFEFLDLEENVVSPETTRHEDWLCMTTESHQQLIIERFVAVAEIFGLSDLLNVGCDITSDKLEEKLINVCEQLMIANVSVEFEYNIRGSMTILHLAAALGYRKLIQLLYIWLEKNCNSIMLVEACPKKADQFGLVPVMWAAALGHFDALSVLIQWDESSLFETDQCGCTAVALAQEQGHDSVAIYLQTSLKKIQSAREKIIHSSPFTESTSGIGSPGSSSSVLGSPSCPRTLGKTLAHIQSMISEEQDTITEEMEDIESEDESVFQPSPYVARQGSSSEEKLSCQSSPASPGQISIQSPFNRQRKETAEFCEFFYKSRKIEKDFAELTLTDREHEDLFNAANVIQTAFKSFKERKTRREQEFQAATLIQSYYKRYKQYAAFKKMQKGAVVIQNQYRAHREKWKKRTAAAFVIQSFYRSYRERKATSETSLQAKCRQQIQAERKTNRYLKQTTNRFSRELPEEIVNPQSANYEV